jgi:uncharacterized protein DUF4304
MGRRSAQEAFGDLMREHIAPGLRRLGFKGSGRIYQIPDEERWVQLGIQRSLRSDAREIRFTINVAMVGRRAWDAARHEHPYLPKRPSPNVRYGDYVWSKRVGTLMPAGNDHWWRITPETDLAKLARDVLTMVSKHVLPPLQHEVSTDL